MSPIFFFISAVVPLGIYFFLPPLMGKVTGKGRVSRTPLAIACLLFFISWYLPSPLIRGVDTSFTTHFVGGGLFTGFLYAYIKNCMRWKYGIFFDLLALYILVNALGVANELFEFAVVETGFASLDPSDTWWDLLTNNMGAFVFFIGYAAMFHDKK